MKRGSAINRAKYPPPILYYPSYTLTSPFNTQRVINTVKPKLLSVPADSQITSVLQPLANFYRLA